MPVKAALHTVRNELDVDSRQTLADVSHQQATQTILDMLPDPVLMFDAAGTLSYINQVAETALGCRRVRSENDPLQELEPTVRATVEQLRQHVLDGNGPYIPHGLTDALCITCAEGERYFLPRATPIYDAQCELTGVTVLLQEVIRLGRFDKLNGDLIASLAHELRTPLTSLQVAVQLCLEQIVGPLTEKQLDLLKIAQTSCNRLQAAVDDMVDLSRIPTSKADKQ